jgi:Rrf2 family transcriptional regulator, iron-sulfur cluster assembly transcription factor
MYGTSQKLYILVEALLYIAHHPAMQPLSGKKLSDALHVPPRYLELWMQSLVKANILRSIRGPRGGYMLALDRREIRMDDILRACAAEQEQDMPPSSIQKTLVRPLFLHAQEAYRTALAGVTLDQLCDRALVHGLSRTLALDKHYSTDRLDFSI